MGRRKRKSLNQVPCFVLTPETITLIQQALQRFEEPLSQVHHQETKVAFAEETLHQVKGKLTAMKQSIGALCLITFDANEKVILTAALRLYLLELIALPRTPQRAKALSACHKLLAQFRVEPGKQA
ncbi:MAG TPA: hypothetical protein VFV38_10080 [Ktedonobacteraceae bacterium]|nr:hypothetical protein [Ktedonobacteraceae bacterium]